MFVWEAQLANMRNAWEFKLGNYRKRWWAANNIREGMLKGTSSYGYMTERMQDLERMIEDCLDSISRIDGIANTGPIAGGCIALVVRRDNEGRKLDVPQTRSIIDIIADYAESLRSGETKHWSDNGIVNDEEALLIATGVEQAKAILINPYKYLDPGEQEQYDLVGEKMAEKLPEVPVSKTATQIARDLVEELRDAEEVPRRRGGGKRVSEPALPSIAELEAMADDDDDVVVRRR